MLAMGLAGVLSQSHSIFSNCFGKKQYECHVVEEDSLMHQVLWGRILESQQVSKDVN